MSNRLLPIRLASVVLVGGLSLAADAKAPDLPLNPSITCVAEAPPSPASCPAMGGETPKAAEPACPYLKQRQAAQQLPATKPGTGCGPSVLDNLDKLEQAQKLFHRAEFYRRTGRPGMATLYFEKVHALVPGSSWDERANAQLVLIRAQQLSGEEPAEADDPHDGPAPQAWQRDELPRIDAHARVTKLLKRCEQAFEAGDYETAERLVLKAALRMQRLRQQMYTLSPRCEPVDAEEPAEASPDAPSEPATEEVEPPSASSLVPEFPAIDPKIVDALEKVLVEAGDPGTARLTIDFEEIAGTEEQEEEPVSQWPYVPFETEMPSLFIAPPPQDPALDDGDAAPEEDSADDDDSDASPPRDINAVLRGALEAIQQGACVEVDVQRPENLRLRCEFEVAGLRCRVLCDWAGHSYVVCAVAPEASGDLRAIQLAHNQQVIDWIESTSTLGLANADDEDGAEEEDPIDDTPDDDETP